MVINGFITTREVIRHAALIVREFGPAVFLRCCAAVVLGRRTTFLACACRVPVARPTGRA